MTEPLEQVVLVDETDRTLGTAEKMAAHRHGMLHRAFSVVVTREDGRWLLQRRAADKYHSGGLWSNTCCSHPRPGESVADAAVRRLYEEMGMSAVMERLFEFTYRVEFEDGLIEHEFDHVLLARSSDSPSPDDREVSGWRWVCPDDLLREVGESPERFTFWFRRLIAETARRHPDLVRAAETSLHGR